MKRVLAFLVLFWTFFGLVVYAQQAENYKNLPAGPAEIIVDGSGDSLSIGTQPLASRDRKIKGNTTVAARIDFSGAPGDTVLVYCNIWTLSDAGVYSYVGTTQVTVEAGNMTDIIGDNIGENIAVFDTYAGDRYEIRVGPPSAGTVDVTVWTYGADSE